MHHAMYVEDKDEFFHVMEQAEAMVDGPRIILEDFNMYRFANEKSRGRVNWSVMEAFNEWIREQDMDIDISNKQELHMAE